MSFSATKFNRGNFTAATLINFNHQTTKVRGQTLIVLTILSVASEKKIHLKARSNKPSVTGTWPGQLILADPLLFFAATTCMGRFEYSFRSLYFIEAFQRT